MKKTEIYLDVYGIKVVLETNLADFAEFVTKNYYYFIKHNKGSYDIKVNYSYDAGIYASDESGKLDRFGKDIFIKDNSIYWENEFGFKILIDCKGRSFNIFAFHEDLNNDQSYSERLKNFQRSMRWAVHFPVFMLLHNKYKGSLIHASAVSKNGKALVFCGLNKVGKSTLALYLSLIKNYSFITDNFLYCTNEFIYGFPEVLRLSPESINFFNLPIPEDNNNLVYEKYHLELKILNIDVLLKSRPKIFFLVTGGDEVKLTPLKKEHAINTMQGLHRYLGEFPDFSFFSMLPYITEEKVMLYDHTHLLERDDITFFQLKIPLKWKELYNISEVLECF